jgi:hypothetical protein
MHINLYKNSAPPNKVDKTSNLSNDSGNINVRFTRPDSFDILNPTVIISLSDVSGFDNSLSDIKKYNYMYVSEVSRYYFIDSISTENGLVKITGRCDVLMSHKKDIYASKQYILRQESKNNSPYLDDNMLPISSKHNYKGDVFGDYVSDVTCGRVILATTGKGGTPI